MPIIAKLERPEAIDRLDEILDAADAVMVARGDLGLEIPLERVPRVQKEILRKARARGVPVIVATQVLESMRTEPRPTRAEASDAAGAVDGGADAIMLSGETATGFYPVRSVEVLDAIIRDAESMAAPPPEPIAPPMGIDYVKALSEAAVSLSRRSNAYAIVAITREGQTARLLVGDPAAGADRGGDRQDRGRAVSRSLARRHADRLRSRRRHRTGHCPRRRLCGEAIGTRPRARSWSS